MSKTTGVEKLTGIPGATHGESAGEVSVTFSGEAPSAPLKMQVLEPVDRSCKRRCELGVVRGFLSPAEVLEITDLVQSAGLSEVKDRDMCLKYMHNAFRCERQVRDAKPKIYNRLIDTAWACDGKLWQGIGEGFELYPELEYIEYDVSRMQRNGSIDPHCDNGSKVSMIVLLSDPTEFLGGANFFENGTETGKRVDLKMGDAVFFRGEECEHWIAPVTVGRRAVLQLELSDGHSTWDPLMLWYFFGVLFPTTIAAFTILTTWVHINFAPFILIGLVFLGRWFRTTRRFPPSIRCSIWKQVSIVTASVSWCIFLACIPVLADMREEYLYRISRDPYQRF